MKRLLFATTFCAGTFLITACDKHDRSFSMLSENQSFEQAAEYTPRKIDILWIVDNSGSMQSSQQKLTDSFGSFINRFQTLRYDFHMAVQTTDAYQGLFNSNQNLFRFKDGVGTTHSGVFVMDKDTGNLANVFLTNATQGTAGTGDERAFSSLEATLSYDGNADFRRTDAFLAVIIVSDEDDFSSTTSAYLNNNYNSPNLISLSYYKNYLQTFAGADNFSVNVISIMDGDTNCLNTLNAEVPGRRFGLRYQQLADMTGGIKADICQNFGESLKLISDQILKVSSKYVLTREPIVESITVRVDGVLMPQDSVNGWSYDPATMTITFNGSATPAVGSQVQILFDPAKPKN